MEKKHYVLGVEVDKATFDKYANRKYPMKGHKGEGISLKALHLFATDEDIAKDLPEVHKEAKKLVAKIKVELTGSGKPSGFKAFLEELNAAHKEAVADFDRIHGALATANKELERAQSDKNAPEYALTIAKGDHARAQMEFEQNKNRPAENFQKRAAEIRERMAAYVGKVYQANPDAVDASTLRLMESGIVTADELSNLSERFRGNVTMLRLMAAHAQKEGKRLMNDNDRTEGSKWNALAYALGTASDSSRAMAGFDSLVDLSVRSMSRRSFGPYPSDGMRGKAYDDAYSEIASAYDRFLIQPTEAVE